MKNRDLLRHLVWLVVIGTLWAWGGKIWYDRARVVFPPDHSMHWEKVSVPADVEMATPGRSTERLPLDKVVTDVYSKVLLETASDPRKSHTNLHCDISALDWLCKHGTDRLRQYLACNPGWCFCRKNDRDVASRRVLKGGQWHNQKWEIDYDVEVSDEDGDGFGDDVCSMCTIDLAPYEFYGTKCRSGENVKLDLKPLKDDKNDSEVVCYGDSVMLNVVEWSSFTTCRVMQTVIDLTKEEFEKVRCATNWPMLKAALPEGAVRNGSATLDLFEMWNSCGKLMGHTYQAWVNPGELGETYLRAFEVSQGVELGAGTDGEDAYLLRDTREYSGWSDDAEEKFLIGAKFGFRGITDKTFAVRLEVWFRPANGGPDRKLVERVFRIDGGCDEGTDHR